MLPTISRSELGVGSGFTVREYLNPGEQEVLLALIGSVDARVVVEVGVNAGKTAQAVLRGIPTVERYIGIDCTPDYVFELPWQQVERPADPGCLVRHDPRFELILRGNGEHHLYHQLHFDHPIDVVFIDGDHGREAVWYDTQAATLVVREGGLIIWHDYHNGPVQVSAVLDRLHADGREIFNVEGTWLAFERR
jgi:predicted O-methyltransferase YrrM